MLYRIKRQDKTHEIAYVIHNEQHQPILITNSLSEQNEPLILRDEMGKEYTYILEDLSALRDAFDIYLQQQVLASVKKTMLPFLRNRYLISVMNGTIFSTQGNISQYHYTIRRGYRAVASVVPDFSQDQDYHVTINSEEDTLLLLTSIIVIDILSSR